MVQPVSRPLPQWPTHQRFDYLVRTRPLTSQERKLVGKTDLDPIINRLREPALFVLKELTGKDYGSDVEKWRKLKKLLFAELFRRVEEATLYLPSLSCSGGSKKYKVAARSVVILVGAP